MQITLFAPCHIQGQRILLEKCGGKLLQKSLSIILIDTTLDTNSSLSGHTEHVKNCPLCQHMFKFGRLMAGRGMIHIHILKSTYRIYLQTHLFSE